MTRYFRKRSSVAYRARSESFARVTSSLAESVNGMREIQSFARDGKPEEILEDAAARGCPRS
jgi:ABC-type multidrug transport system fused ATPase/permease subunit